jgi:hypothetical protein
MSYYENRIKALEARVDEMAKRERMKAIPVEAKLMDIIKEQKEQIERLTKAGDAMADTLRDGGVIVFGYSLADEWLKAKLHAAKGVQS